MRLVKALISLCVCAGWSEPLQVAHTTLLEISCCVSNASSEHYTVLFVLGLKFQMLIVVVILKRLTETKFCDLFMNKALLPRDMVIHGKIDSYMFVRKSSGLSTAC